MFPMSLTFEALRQANIARIPEFKNNQGEPAHKKPDGSDWSLGEWSNAVLGELGEAANLIKKIKRGDYSLEEKCEDLGKELADVQIYLDILALQAGIDLGQATIDKWNEVSKRVECDLRIEANGPYRQSWKPISQSFAGRTKGVTVRYNVNVPNSNGDWRDQWAEAKVTGFSSCHGTVLVHLDNDTKHGTDKVFIEVKQDLAG
jgi:NTP pyrophosphatase (non-canonical NTP hydrolase)